MRFAAGLEHDADRAAAGLVTVRGALAGAVGVDSEETPPTTLWLTTASKEIGPGSALTVSDSTRATVYVQSPGCAPNPERFHVTLLHELSGEYLQAATRLRDGWTFYTAPPWFVQGLEEWVTRVVAQPDVDPASTAAASPDRAITVRNGALAVEDPYRDGLALISWLVVTHGADAPFRVLASDAPTFAAALSEIVGLDEAGVVEAYQRWRQQAPR